MAKPLTGSSFVRFAEPLTRRATCRRSPLRPAIKTFSTSSMCREEEERYGNRGRELREGPSRWHSTPPRYRAPVRSKPAVANNEFVVNEDHSRVDETYVRMLGENGDSMLTDEVKWLAITHKSFDHGKRGFNDRLAYLGKRIVELQTSLALVHMSSTTHNSPGRDQFGREPFQHPALEGLDGLTDRSKATVLDERRIANVAESYGLERIIRWKPRRVTDLEGSGLTVVVAQALYAIVGAVALQRGGHIANDVVRERILNPLGLQ